MTNNSPKHQMIDVINENELFENSLSEFSAVQFPSANKHSLKQKRIQSREDIRRRIDRYNEQKLLKRQDNWWDDDVLNDLRYE